MSDTTLTFRILDDEAEFTRLIAENWGGEILIMRGRPYRPADLVGFGCFLPDGKLAGFAATLSETAALNILAINAFAKGLGIGRALLDHLREVARGQKVRALRIMTTNDNLEALKFYQLYGFRLSALMVGAIDAYRIIKPKLPLRGHHGIPISDTLELELML